MSESAVSAKNQKAAQDIIRECVSKVASTQIKMLWQLNKAYREAKHDLELMERVGVVTKNDVEKAMDNIRFQYVEKGLKIGDEDYEN